MRRKPTREATFAGLPIGEPLSSQAQIWGDAFEAPPFPCSMAFQRPRRAKAPTDLIRLELEAKELPSSRKLRGRVYLSLISFARVERITLLVARVLAITYPNENIKVNDRGTEPIIHLPTSAGRPYDRDRRAYSPYSYERNSIAQDGYYRDAHGNIVRATPVPRKVTTLDPVSRMLNFRAGKYAIPILLYLPESEFPSFTYVHPKSGTAVVSSQSIRSHIILSGGLYKTGTIPIWVPSIGAADNGTSLVDGNAEMAAPKKYVTRGDAIKAVLGDKENKVKKVEARLVSRVTCRAANLDEETVIINWTALQEKSGPKSDVLREFVNNNNRHNLSSEWKKHWEVKDFKFDTYSTPTIITAEFSLQYFLQLKTDDGQYETPIILVDLVNEPDFKPPQISAEMHNRRFFDII